MNIYTVEEVAEMLKLNPETVRRYLLSGKLKGIKLGKTWRIDSDALNEFLDRSRVN